MKTRPVDKAEAFTLNPTKPHASGPLKPQQPLVLVVVCSVAKP